MHAKSDSYTLSCRSAALPGAHAEPLYIYLSAPSLSPYSLALAFLFFLLFILFLSCTRQT